MEPVRTIVGTVAPLLRDNIDTDAIIPAEYMRSLSSSQGRGLFARWRYLEDGSDDPSFVLNDPFYRNARILFAGANFGCGSSRENAVWALHEFGIRCVIALGFSDIFFENCFKNGLLPIRLPAPVHAELVRAVAAHPPLELSVDVSERSLSWLGRHFARFDLDNRKQAALVSGLDDISATLALEDRIEAFRVRHRRDFPWLYDAHSRTEPPAITGAW
jgi:3-isopropylmalate/(R)-2-methylmalate dehydratase small subunit